MVMTEGTGGGGGSTGGTGYLVNTCTNGSFERDTISQAQTYSDGSLGSSWTLGGGYGNRYSLSTTWKGPSSVGVQSIQARTIYADYGNPASIRQTISVTSGHLYFYTAWANKVSANASVADFVITDGNNTQISTFSNGESRVYQTFRPTSNTVTIKLRIKQSGIDGNSDICYFDNVMLIDITATYGAGYEPSVNSLATLITNGGGYWDGSKAVSSISSGTVLSPPTSLSGTPDNGSVILRWTHSYSTLPQYYNWWTQDSSGNWFKQGIPQIPGTSTSYTLTGLNNGQTYSIALSAHNTYGDSARSNVISITPGSSALSAPQSLTVQNNGTSNPTVTWNSVSGATGYHISQVMGAPYIVSVGTNSWTVNGAMVAGTYNIYVNAYNNTGESTYSGPVTMVIGAGQGSSGGTPADFTLTAIATYGQVSLTWGASSGASMYQVYRSTDNTANPVMRVNNVTGTSYVDNAENGHTYYYYITAVSDTSNKNSNTVAATPSATAGSALPDQITNFRASPGSTTVTLSWDWISIHREIIQGYRIYDPNVGLIWSNNEGNDPVSLDPYESFTLSTTIRNLQPSTSYTFSIVAYFPDNAGGAEGPGTSVTFTTQDVSAPGPPTNIQVNDGATASTISWVRPNAGEAGYRIYNADNTILMGSISSNISQVQISGLKGGQTYSCYMCCYITSPSFRLGTKSANFVLAPLVNNPSMPNSFSVYIDNGVPVLNWSAPTNSGTPAYVGYHIYRQTQDILTGTIIETFDAISPYATPSPSATQFRDNAVSKKRIYSYYITAYANDSGTLVDGDKTAIKTARIIDRPQAVQNLSIRLVNGVYPVIKWNPPVDDGGEFPLAYRIFCGTSSNTTEVSVVDNIVNEAIHIDTSTDTTYYYSVTALNNAGESDKASVNIAIPADAENNIIYSVTNLVINGSFDLDMGTAAWLVSPPVNATIIDALPGMVYENALKLTGPCEAYQDIGVEAGHTLLAIWVGSVISGSPEVDIYSIGPTNNSYVMSLGTVIKYFEPLDIKDTDEGVIRIRLKCAEGSSCMFDGIMLIDLTNVFGHGATFSSETKKYTAFMNIINNFVSGYWEGTFTIPSG